MLIVELGHFDRRVNEPQRKRAQQLRFATFSPCRSMSPLMPPWPFKLFAIVTNSRVLPVSSIEPRMAADWRLSRRALENSFVRLVENVNRALDDNVDQFWLSWKGLFSRLFGNRRRHCRRRGHLPGRGNFRPDHRRPLRRSGGLIRTSCTSIWSGSPAHSDQMRQPPLIHRQNHSHRQSFVFLAENGEIEWPCSRSRIRRRSSLDPAAAAPPAPPNGMGFPWASR